MSWLKRQNIIIRAFRKFPFMQYDFKSNVLLSVQNDFKDVIASHIFQDTFSDFQTYTLNKQNIIIF